MTTRILLDATVVRELLKDDEATVELTKTAAAQVAQRLMQKLRKEELDQRLGDMVKKLMTDGHSWNPRLSEAAGSLMRSHMQALCAEYIQMLSTANVQDMLRIELKKVLDEHALWHKKRLEDTADQLLRERFAAMFGGKAS